jgi:hypothetical protein
MKYLGKYCIAEFQTGVFKNGKVYFQDEHYTKKDFIVI